MRERIFRPLGMDHSAFLARGEVGSDVAKAYRGGREMSLLPMRDLPATGLSTSAADLGRFMQAMLTNRKADGGISSAPRPFGKSWAPRTGTWIST